jgi:hypothetical protein
VCGIRRVFEGVEQFGDVRHVVEVTHGVDADDGQVLEDMPTPRTVWWQVLADLAHDLPKAFERIPQRERIRVVSEDVLRE